MVVEKPIPSAAGKRRAKPSRCHRGASGDKRSFHRSETFSAERADYVEDYPRNGMGIFSP